MSTVKARQEKEAERIQSLDNFLSLHNQKSKNIPAVNLMECLEPYSEFFINDGYNYKFKTKSNSLDRKLHELVRHVFAKYKVPKHLTDVWSYELKKRSASVWNRRELRFERLLSENTISDDLVLWYVCVAQGGSLYKEHAKKYLTKKEVHIFLNHTHDLTVAQSLVFATAMTFAANDGVALRLAKSTLSKVSFTDFLKTVIYFFAKNVPTSIEEVDDLTDFIVARYRERVEDRPPFSMVGFTLDSLRKKCIDWHYELRRVKVMGSHEWEGAAIPDDIIETKSDHGTIVRWYFTQIKDAKALAAEGTRMRHCVYSYRDRCIQSQVYIWSLSKEEYVGTISKKVTIELRNDGSIVQARGVANRQMKRDERNAVERWAHKHGLRVSC